MYILGISCYYHDSAAALIKDGIVIAAAEEERFSRIKHDHRFPMLAIKFCLEQEGISAQDLDYVTFYEKPGLKLQRVLFTLGEFFPASFELFSLIHRSWGREKLWISETIQRRLSVPRSRVLFSEHHLSHAASAFYCSPFEDASILTVDGVGEWVTTSFGHASGNKFTRHAATNFPHSLGLMYSAFTEFLGFEVNDGEYKVMGMAPYGSPLYTEKVRKVFLDVGADSFELDMDYFAYRSSAKSNLTAKFVDLFGEPRKKEEPFFTKKLAAELPDQPVPGSEVLERSTYYADLAASVQLVVEDVLLGFCQALKKRNESRHLCLAGGVAYNSVANGRILREAGFQDYYIQPAAGDSGGAIGAALAVYYADNPRKRPQLMEHPYLGKAFTDSESKTVLDKAGYTYQYFEDEDRLVAHVAQLLAGGKVIGWHQGRFEFGPRALGCRSILADPRKLAMKEVVNARVKFRELFRPFAPSVLEPYADTYYDLSPCGAGATPYHFMLCVVPVRSEHVSHLQATSHMGSSSRVQVVRKNTNPRYYKLVEAFGKLTGTYALLNTSFNRRGEPIVTSPQDALTTFEWSAIDSLVLGGCVLNR